jgi:tetratricopeptide (TPR) repeat protein
MAIIKCPECGQSVSELAANCPGCGCPINGNIDRCPECGETVLKSYTECPKCHCPIKQFEEKKANGEFFYKKAFDAFNAGQFSQASNYIESALTDTPDDSQLLNLKSKIDAKLQVSEQKYNEAQHLFEEKHNVSALALINKLIAADPADKYNALKEQIITTIIGDQLNKANALLEAKKPEEAVEVLMKAKSFDADNIEVKHLLDIANEKVAKKRRTKRNTIIGIIVAVVIAILIGAFYFFSSMQAENDAWDRLQTSTNLNDYQEFLAEYPNGRHYAEAKALYDKLSTELTDWASVSASVDKYAVKAFLSKYPNGVCADQAKSRLDSLSWVDACHINKPEAYAQYIVDFPNGKYFSEAQQKSSQLKDMEVSPNEQNQITTVITQFFTGIAAKDETQLLSSVESTMTKFLNKRNATKAHVLTFMNQMHASDMTAITFTVNNDLRIAKKQLSDGQYSYAVTCTVDEKIERSEPGETFINYGVTFDVDNFMKISSLSLKKISSSTNQQ